MAQVTRIYLVKTPDGKTRLIRAGVSSQAMNHVAKELIEVKVASQDELVDALLNGIAVEHAVLPTQAEPNPVAEPATQDPLL